MKPLLYALPGNETLARGLAEAWPADGGDLELHRFPDRETLVRLAKMPRERDVVLVCTLNDPDVKLWPLLAAAGTAREFGARSVGLIAPYLAYMRQDQRFAAGQAVTARQFAALLSQHFDWLATVDPHLHRVHALEDIYTIPCATIAAAPVLAQWIGTNVDRPLLIGPDDESRQWVERIAQLARVPSTVLAKRRLGDEKVTITLPDLNAWRDHTPVIVDDIISSGGTLAETIRRLHAQGLRPPVCVAVHAVFTHAAYEGLLEAGALRIVTTNSIAHASNGIELAATIATECRALLARQPFQSRERRLAQGSAAG